LYEFAVWILASSLAEQDWGQLKTRAPMIRKTIDAFSKRAFLNPASTHLTSYIEAHVQTGREGPDKWGENLVTIGDCKRVVQLEFFLGSKRDRRLSLAKIDLLIKVLTQFRTALVKEIKSIEDEK
jgi:hypothetical protein